VPADCVTTHTVFCVRPGLTLDRQRVLCGLLNSFVANYLMRLRVSTHVTVSLMARLRVPRVEPACREFRQLLDLSTTLAAHGVDDVGSYAELQALAARLSRISREEFQHVLGTFPLIGAEVKTSALALFDEGS
jgi:hypothetical protein